MAATDVLVLGATGFTGKILVECFAKTQHDVSWSMTGRSKDKLRELVQELHLKDVDISNIPTFIVDVTNKESLKNALKETKIVLNCVGPNTTLSGPIVECCIETRTHYVDISAEVNHILDLYIKYHKMAEEANVLIVPSCGFASLLAASGLLYLTEQFQGTLLSVECYMDLDLPGRAMIPLPGNCLVHYGTWESLVYVMRNMKKYQSLKAETFPPIEPLPKEIDRNFLHYRRRRLWFPYPGPDQDVIQMSEHYLNEKRRKKPVHFKLYTAMPYFFHYIIIPMFFFYYYMSYFNWFCKLLWRFPRVFTLGYMSHKGPSQKMQEAVKFSFTFKGKGWHSRNEDFSAEPNKTVKVKVSSSNAYKSTAAATLAAGITLLQEPLNMPSGGVVNVGAAFQNTGIVKTLADNGIKYETLP